MAELTFRFATPWFRSVLTHWTRLQEAARKGAKGQLYDEKAVWESFDEIRNICQGQERLADCSAIKQLDNTIDAWQRWKKAERKDTFAAYTLLPFLAELREEIYFFGCVYPQEEKMKQYYEEEFVPHCEKEDILTQDRPKYTIFIPACGHLAYTKQCVESVMRTTKEDSCEWLLIDHGSPDDTISEYFATIKGAETIRFFHNVRMLMFGAAYRAARGKYLVFVSNDTIVQGQWLKELTACLQADPLALSATPVTPHTSNAQSLPPCDVASLAAYAEQIRQKKQGIFVRRARIMPVIAVYDTEKLEKIGFADRLFQTMEFWDDDLSARARTAGFAQYLCEGVYCHHFGSVTGKEQWRHTLEQGRKLFLKKHGFDAWGVGYCAEESMISLAKEAVRSHCGQSEHEEISVLGVFCGLGDGFLALCHQFRQAGFEPRGYLLAQSEAMRGQCYSFAAQSMVAAEGILSGMESLGERQFAWIYLERGVIPNAEDWRALWQALEEGGMLLCAQETIPVVFSVEAKRKEWSLLCKRKGVFAK